MLGYWNFLKKVDFAPSFVPTFNLFSHATENVEFSLYLEEFVPTVEVSFTSMSTSLHIFSYPLASFLFLFFFL